MTSEERAKELTPSMWTVLAELGDDWGRTLANLNTLIALEDRGLIETEARGRFGLDSYARRTDAGRQSLESRS